MQVYVDQRFMAEGVIFEVLLRLPVKSLIRFKATCKAWHALISEPYFIASHYEHSRATPSLLILPLKQDLFHETMDLYSYKKEARVSELLLHTKLPRGDMLLSLYPCEVKGLIMLFSERSIHICNPSTKEFLTLPKGSLSPPHSDHIHRYMGFGFDSSTNRYKVVRTFLRNVDNDTQDYGLGCEVCTLGDGSWRAIDGPSCPVVSHCPVTVGEVIYWPAYEEEHGRAAILLFSLRDERFGMVRAPPFEANANHIPLLAALEGDLSYVVHRFDSDMMDIWVLNACNNTWSKKYSIDTGNLNLRSLIAMHDGKILLSSGNRLAYFDPRSKTLTAVVAIGGLSNEEYPWKQPCMSVLDGSLHFFVSLYAESLVSVTTG